MMQFATQVYLTYVLTTLLVLTQLATADYDMYILRGGSWMLFDDKPDCKTFNVNNMLTNTNDVSKTWGVRCANKGKEHGICDYDVSSYTNRIRKMHLKEFSMREILTPSLD